MWSSAGLVHLLLGLTCCAFRGDPLHAKFCVSLKQSGHSALIYGISKTFTSREELLTGYFLHFTPYSVNPKDGCAQNLSR